MNPDWTGPVKSCWHYLLLVCVLSNVTWSCFRFSKLSTPWVLTPIYIALVRVAVPTPRGKTVGWVRPRFSLGGGYGYA